MRDLAVSVHGLSKRYRIAHARHRHDTLRDQVMDRLRSLGRLGRGDESERETLWALRDVSFEVCRGEVLGLVGRNGAGKSTLLKILARITEPTSGRAELHGRVGSLLEVGTGFDRELTGRENVFLSGAVLGMSRAEIRRKFDDIVSFAEVEKFIDTPIKRYSSGMYLRLAFAVAAHLEPEILVVDEVLAVGDASFQKKCLGKMGEVAGQGRTVLFVSHNMAAVTHLCQRALWLDHGRVVAHDAVESIVARYLASGVQERGEVSFTQDSLAPGSDYVRLRAVRIRNAAGEVATSLDLRQSFTIEVEYRVLKRSTNLRVGIRLTTHDGVNLLSSTDTDDALGGAVREPGIYVSRCTLPGDFLNHQQYFVSVGSDSPMLQSHLFLDRVLTFHVEPTGGVGGSVPDGRSGLLRVRLPWDIEFRGSEGTPRSPLARSGVAGAR